MSILPISNFASNLSVQMNQQKSRKQIQFQPHRCFFNFVHERVSIVSRIAGHYVIRHLKNTSNITCQHHAWIVVFLICFFMQELILYSSYIFLISLVFKKHFPKKIKNHKMMLIFFQRRENLFKIKYLGKINDAHIIL